MQQKPLKSHHSVKDREILFSCKSQLHVLMNAPCTLPGLLLKKSVGAKRVAHCSAGIFENAPGRIFCFEARALYSTEVQHYCFFCKVITEIALDPSVCETEHLSGVSGLTAGTSR